MCESINRSSPTGEGRFLFDCKCAGDIYDCVQAAIDAMAKEKRQAAASVNGVGNFVKYI